MEYNYKIVYDAVKQLLIKYSSFASEIASIKIEYRTNLKYHTAATDGKNIYLDPNYFENLDMDGRVFLLAHEIMHIKFEHMFRLTDENGVKRNLDVWNEATDAIINANLERDGFKIKKGYVNIPDATKFSSEELYSKLFKENQDNEEQQKDKNQSGDDGESGNENNSDDFFQDDHSFWEEAFEKEQESTSQDKEEVQENTPQSTNKPKEDKFNEKEQFSKNREEKERLAKEALERKKEEMLKNFSSDKTFFGEVGFSKEEIDWKLLLRREIEKEENVWTQRRSILENNYAYRLEDYELDEEAETEVMIDVSGSVSIDLVRGFLRNLKPILKESKLKVGCFNEKFWGMVEIKSNKEIDNFSIPNEARSYNYAWTEDWDLAVRSFTKKQEINKIVFTDGYPAPGTMPKEDLKRENIIWLVYGNKNFKPCCGKVIHITPSQLERINLKSKDIKEEGKSR